MTGRDRFRDSVRSAALPLALLALAIAWALWLPRTAGAQGGFSGPGRYEIVDVQSARVLDLDPNDNSSVIQGTPHGTHSQTWEIVSVRSGSYYLRNARNGNALEDSGSNTPLRATQFTGASSQEWRLRNAEDGNALIISRRGKPLDVPTATNLDGSRNRPPGVKGDSSQKFMFRQVFERSSRESNSNSGAITCASNNRRRVYCESDTGTGVQLVREIGDSRCQQGLTWGYDSHRIWVDRGCAAEFVVLGDASGTGAKQ